MITSFLLLTLALGQSTSDSTSTAAGIQVAISAAVAETHGQKIKTVSTDGRVFFDLGSFQEISRAAGVPIARLQQLPSTLFGGRGTVGTFKDNYRCTSTHTCGITDNGILIEMHGITVKGDRMQVELTIRYTDARTNSSASGFTEYRIDLQRSGETYRVSQLKLGSVT